MMENIKSFLFENLLEYIQKKGKVVLPWWWNLLPLSWRKEFSELLLVAIPLLPKTLPTVPSVNREVVLGKTMLAVFTTIALVLFTFTAQNVTPKRETMTMLSKNDHVESLVPHTMMNDEDSNLLKGGFALGEPMEKEVKTVTVPVISITASADDLENFLSQTHAIPCAIDHSSAWVCDSRHVLTAMQNKYLDPSWEISITSTEIDISASNICGIYSSLHNPVLIVQVNK
ncbi:hypothetical protein [Coprothermobacter platensis]|uniref:hypothetical protein n=1 Tax=Coprothermobacter platensis TaxID=108819 RepID=UPI00037BB394|nr:hypothetical protein [Coprothermobacter platensis]